MYKETKKNNFSLDKYLNREIAGLFKDAVRIIFKQPLLASYSDSNLTSMTLKNTLDSEFLRKIRQNHSNLKETRGGCTRWENREWVQSLIKENN